MADHATLGMRLGSRLDLAHRDPRRTRGDDYLGRQQFVELAIEFLFEVDPLGPVFLDEVRGTNCCRQICRECESRLRCAGRKTQSLQRRPGRLNEPSQRHLSVRCNIGRYDVQSLRKEQRRTARANNAGSYDGDVANRLVVRHGLVLLQVGFQISV